MNFRIGSIPDILNGLGLSIDYNDICATVRLGKYSYELDVGEMY